MLWDGRSGAEALSSVARCVGTSLLKIDQLSPVEAEVPLPLVKGSSSSLAHVIYTLGPTGTPKGSW